MNLGFQFYYCNKKPIHELDHKQISLDNNQCGKPEASLKYAYRLCTDSLIFLISML